MKIIIAPDSFKGSLTAEEAAWAMERGVRSVFPEAVIDRILAEKRDFVLDKKDRAIAPLMGLVMKELRGKTDGKILSDMLSEKVKRMLGEK